VVMVGVPCAGRLWSLERAVVFLTLQAIELAATLVEFAILVVSFFYAWFGILVVGVGLILIRKTFLAMIPVLVTLSVPLTFWLNEIIASFDMLENFCILVVKMIGGLLGGGGDVNFVKVHTLTVDSVVDELKHIADTCKSIDSVASIADQWVPALVDELMCPVFRAIWPLPFDIGPRLYGPFDGWVSDPTPFPNGGNCAREATDPGAIVCAALAVGFGVLEVVLPSVFVGLFLMSSGGRLAGFLAMLATVVYRGVAVAACALATAIATLRKSVECACSVAESVL